MALQTYLIYLSSPTAFDESSRDSSENSDTCELQGIVCGKQTLLACPYYSRNPVTQCIYIEGASPNYIPEDDLLTLSPVQATLEPHKIEKSVYFVLAPNIIIKIHISLIEIGNYWGKGRDTIVKLYKLPCLPPL